MTSSPVSTASGQAAAARTALEQRFPPPAADPMMQALFDAVLAWMTERTRNHDPQRDSETD